MKCTYMDSSSTSDTEKSKQEIDFFPFKTSFKTVQIFKEHLPTHSVKFDME